MNPSWSRAIRLTRGRARAQCCAPAESGAAAFEIPRAELPAAAPRPAAHRSRSAGSTLQAGKQRRVEEFGTHSQDARYVWSHSLQTVGFRAFPLTTQLYRAETI